MKKSINFNWDYIPTYKEEYLQNYPTEESHLVNIPHNVNNLPYNYFNENIYQHLSTYRHIFTLDKIDDNKTIFIRFEAFMLKAKVYLNKAYLGEYVSSFSPVEINIEKQYQEGENELIVVLDSSEDANCPPFGYAVDYLTFGGI